MAPGAAIAVRVAKARGKRAGARGGDEIGKKLFKSRALACDWLAAIEPIVTREKPFGAERLHSQIA